MEFLLSGYVIYSLSFILIFISLATLLKLQFSITGIVNFGIVGFWGLGMYTFALLLIKLQMPFVLAIILTIIITGIVALALGRVILNLDEQSVLVATLAFAAIIEHLATTEKWLTNGVMGLGMVEFPFDFGKSTVLVYFLLIFLFTTLLILYVYKLKISPFGRLLVSIKDNEVLAQSLGKPTFRHKIIFFVVTSALIGFFGAMTAPLYNFIFPRMIGAGITFTIWIALLLGGKSRLLGGLVGVLATVGLFDYFIVSVIPIPTHFAEMVPNIKYTVYGLTLILVLMFRPLGILGERKREVTK